MITSNNKDQSLASEENESVETETLKKKINEHKAFFLAYTRNEHSTCLIFFEVSTVTYDDHSTNVPINQFYYRGNNNENVGENDGKNSRRWYI